jgi:hypothetical protein
MAADGLQTLEEHVPRHATGNSGARFAPTSVMPAIAAAPALAWGYTHEVSLVSGEGALRDFRAGDDVPTLRGTLVAHPGYDVSWTILVAALGTKFASRFGVVHAGQRPKADWLDPRCATPVWWLSSAGDLFVGARHEGVATIAPTAASRNDAARAKPIAVCDTVTLSLCWAVRGGRHVGTLTFAVNGQPVVPALSNITGPVQVVCHPLRVSADMRTNP